MHLNANPTQGQLLHKEFKQKKEELKDTSKVSVLAKYGGEEYLQKVPKELLQGQTEEYVEYSRTGQVIHGKERAKARSKYPEDGVFVVLTFALSCCWLTLFSLSLCQQPYRRLGFMVRRDSRHMGLCVLSLFRPPLVLYGRSWQTGLPSFIRSEPTRRVLLPPITAARTEVARRGASRAEG